MQITLEWLNGENACKEGCLWFSAQKETDGVTVVKKLMAEKQLDWANWTIYRIFSDKQRIQYAVYAAEQVAYLWKDRYPKEYGIWKKWVDAGCPESGRAAAWAAAWDAAWAAAGAAAWDAARAAAWAAAWDAARDAAGDAAGDAARAAAWAAAWAAARDAAWAAAGAAAWDAARDAMLTKILNFGIKLLTEAKNA